jgi:hypothetical protein
MNCVDGWEEKKSRRQGKYGKRRQRWEEKKKTKTRENEEREKSWPKYHCTKDEGSG